MRVSIQLATGSTNDAEQTRFSGYVKDRTNEILNINNQIAFLQKDLEESEKKRILLASQVEKQAQDSSNKALELGQILMAVENLVQRCLSKKRKRHAKKVADAAASSSGAGAGAGGSGGGSGSGSGSGTGANNSTGVSASSTGSGGGGGGTGSGGGSSTGAAGSSGTAASSSKGAASQKRETVSLAKKCEQASRDLDIIQQYIGDYEEIFNQCPKESRRAK